MSNRRSDTAVLLVCVTILVAVVVVAAALAFVLAPGDRDPTILVTAIVGSIPATIAAMAAVIKVGTVSAQVADVAADTNKLANGLGDAKIRTAVADVLPDHMVDPEIQEQLRADRARIGVPEDHV